MGHRGSIGVSLRMKQVSGHLQRWDATAIYLVDAHQNESEMSLAGLEPEVATLLTKVSTMLLGMYVVCSYDKLGVRLEAHHAKACGDGDA